MSVDYPVIRAFHEMLGSRLELVRNELNAAAADCAPQDVVHRAFTRAFTGWKRLKALPRGEQQALRKRAKELNGGLMIPNDEICPVCGSTEWSREECRCYSCEQRKKAKEVTDSEPGTPVPA
jgi:hypothetical protein